MPKSEAIEANGFVLSNRRAGMSVVRAIVIPLLTTAVALGQAPELHLRTVVRWPDVSTYFSVACGGDVYAQFDSSAVDLTENSLPVSFRLSCPDSTAHCPMSVALVFDVSSSMSGAGLAGAIAAGNAFVDLMDGLNDEACVVIFGQSAGLLQPMTTDKKRLISAIDGLPLGGSTALWDGIGTGLDEVAGNGVNPCRAVLVLTDGQDNASIRNMADVLEFARARNVRVCSAALGPGAAVNQLQTVAALTGGSTVATSDPSNLPEIFAATERFIQRGFDECTATYRASCPDGTLRTIGLAIHGPCDSAAISAIDRYVAPRDSTAVTPASVRIADASDTANTEIRVPVLLLAPSEAMFGPAFIDVRFDSSVLAFSGIGAVAGGVRSSPAIEAYDGNYIRLRFEDDAKLSAKDTLFTLVFRGVQRPDTATGAISIENWVFDAGCLSVTAAQGEVRVLPAAPRVQFTALAIAATLVADTANGLYTPMPFPLDLAVRNVGGRDSDTAFARVLLPPIFRLTGADSAAGVTRVMTGGTIPFRGTATAEWHLVRDPSRKILEYEIPVRVWAHGADTATAVARIRVPALPGPRFLPVIAAPDVVETNGPSGPTSFDVAVSLGHLGGLEVHNLACRIDVPRGLVDVNAGSTELPLFVPPDLKRGELTDPLRWTLAFDSKLTVDTTVTLGWTVTFHDASGTVDSVVLVHPLQVLVRDRGAYCDVLTPDTLFSIGRAGLTNPSPYPVTARFQNDGASSVTIQDAWIDISGTRLLLDPSTPTRASLNVVLAPSMAITTSWLLTARTDSLPQGNLHFAIRATTIGDTLACARTVPHIHVEDRCDMLSDVSRIEYGPNGYQTTAWSVHATLTNDGDLPLAPVRVWLDIAEPAGSGLVRLDSTISGNTAVRILPSVPAGESRTVDWTVGLRESNRTGKPVDVCFRTSYADYHGGLVTNGCEACVAIDPMLLDAVGAPSPRVPTLGPNRPNPAHGQTTIDFALPRSASVRLALFDLLGREVARVVDGLRPAGAQSAVFDLSGLPPGVYVYRLDAVGRRLARAMVVR